MYTKCTRSVHEMYTKCTRNVHEMYTRLPMCTYGIQKCDESVYLLCYSLLHLECHFFNLKSQSIIQFSRSLLPRFVEQGPMRMRLETEIQRHSKCNRLYIERKHTHFCVTIPEIIYITFGANARISVIQSELNHIH